VIIALLLGGLVYGVLVIATGQRSAAGAKPQPALPAAS
jgi:hypothetical protein